MNYKTIKNISLIGLATSVITTFGIMYGAKLQIEDELPIYVDTAC